MPTRIFTRGQLDDWNLPGAWADGSPEILHREQTDSRRWVSVHELIFRAPDDGLPYRVYYERGLITEYEHCDPWCCEDEIEAVEVEQQQVTVTRWVPVTGERG
jgi:hypothetical protein